MHIPLISSKFINFLIFSFDCHFLCLVYVCLPSPYFDHDAFTHNALQVAYWTPLTKFSFSSLIIFIIIIIVIIVIVILVVVVILVVIILIIINKSSFNQNNRMIGLCPHKVYNQWFSSSN